MSIRVNDRLRAHLKGLFGFAYTLTRNRETARDLTQDVVVKALVAQNVPDDDAAFRVWLFRIARNTFVDDVRRLRPDSTDPIELEKHIGSDDWNEQRQINIIAVRQAFAEISDDHRQVLALIDVAGMTYAETADVLGVPIGTVMSRLSRARSMILQHVEADNVTCFPVPLRRVQKR